MASENTRLWISYPKIGLGFCLHILSVDDREAVAKFHKLFLTKFNSFGGISGFGFFQIYGTRDRMDPMYFDNHIFIDFYQHEKKEGFQDKLFAFASAIAQELDLELFLDEPEDLQEVIRAEERVLESRRIKAAKAIRRGQVPAQNARR
jgi:hypothetical protein